MEGQNFWHLVTLPGSQEMRLVTNNTYVGEQVFHAEAKAKVLFKDFITDYEGKTLDMYFELNPNTVWYTTHSIFSASPWQLSLFYINANTNTIEAEDFTVNADGSWRSFFGRCSSIVDFRASFKYAGTNTAYVSEYPAAWMYSDIDQPTEYYNAYAVPELQIQWNTPDSTQAFFYNEAIHFDSTTSKTYVSSQCKLGKSADNTWFYSTGNPQRDYDGVDEYEYGGVIAVQNASSFSFRWVGSSCGTRLFDSANYLSGMRLSKTPATGTAAANTQIQGSLPSLEGAVYGIYADETCTNKLAEMITDEKGAAQSGKTLDLEPKRYYVKELSVPVGYKLDSAVHSIDLSDMVGKWAPLEVSETPEVFLIETSVENGTIDSASSHYLGDECTVNYAPDEGYHLENVVVDGQDVNIKEYPSSYTFEDIYADHTIDVAYEKDLFIIETSVENGTISRASKQEYGSTRTIEYAPYEGYHLDSVTIDGEAKDIKEFPSEHTFANICADHVIEVVFEADPEESEPDDSPDPEPVDPDEPPDPDDPEEPTDEEDSEELVQEETPVEPPDSTELAEAAEPTESVVQAEPKTPTQEESGPISLSRTADALWPAAAIVAGVMLVAGLTMLIDRRLRKCANE